MSELNRENIIKALECCTHRPRCRECPFTIKQCENVRKDALALIKELIEENERLNLVLLATTERSESRKEADISEILELRLKVNEFSEEIDRLIDKQRKEDGKND